MAIVDVRGAAPPRGWSEDYERDGYAVLSGVVPPWFVAETRRLIGELRSDGRVPSPELDELTRHRWLVEVGATALGVDAVGPVAWSFVRVHHPGDESSLVPWHQDVQCLESLVGDRFVTLWIPVAVDGDEPVVEVAVAPADHRMYERAISLRTGYACMREQDVGLLGETRPLHLHLGDLLVLASSTPHRSAPNRSARSRWSVDLRLVPVPERSVRPVAGPSPSTRRGPDENVFY